MNTNKNPNQIDSETISTLENMLEFIFNFYDEAKHKPLLNKLEHAKHKNDYAQICGLLCEFYYSIDKYLKIIETGVLALNFSCEEPARIHHMLGHAYLNLQAPNEALHQFERAKSNGFNTITNKINIGSCHTHLKQYDTANTIFKDLLKSKKNLNKSDYSLLLANLAEINFKKGKYIKCIDLYKQSLTACDDTTKKVHHLLKTAKSYLKISQPKSAIEYYTQALNIEKNEEEIIHLYRKIGIALLKHKAFEFALFYLEKYIKIRSENHYNETIKLCLFYLRQKNFYAATNLLEYEQAKFINKDSAKDEASFKFQQTIARRLEKSADSAYLALLTNNGINTELKKLTKNTVDYYNTGINYFNDGDYVKAAACFIKTNQNHGFAYRELAKTYLKLADKSAAIICYTQGIDILQQKKCEISAMYYYERGMLFSKLNQSAMALDDLTHAMELHTEDDAISKQEIAAKIKENDAASENDSIKNFASALKIYGLLAISANLTESLNIAADEPVIEPHKKPCKNRRS